MVENAAPKRGGARESTTPRLTIRSFTEQDLDDLRLVLGDDEVMRFSLDGAVQDDDEIRSYIAKHQGMNEENGSGMRALMRKSDERVIGFCGPCWQEVDGEKQLEIGYRLARDCWGQGYAPEAAAAMRDYAFEHFDVDHLISIIEAANVRSIRVAEKIGMAFSHETRAWDIPVRIYRIDRVDK